MSDRRMDAKTRRRFETLLERLTESERPVKKDDLTEEQHNAMLAAWAESGAGPLWEAEAKRMFPDQPHLGRFDGIVSNDMVETLIFARREAFEWGARWEWERAYCEALDSSEAG